MITKPQLIANIRSEAKSTNCWNFSTTVVQITNLFDVSSVKFASLTLSSTISGQSVNPVTLRAPRDQPFEIRTYSKRKRKNNKITGSSTKAMTWAAARKTTKAGTRSRNQGRKCCSFAMKELILDLKTDRLGFEFRRRREAVTMTAKCNGVLVRLVTLFLRLQVF